MRALVAAARLHLSAHSLLPGGKHPVEEVADVRGAVMAAAPEK